MFVVCYFWQIIFEYLYNGEPAIEISLSNNQPVGKCGLLISKATSDFDF